MLRYPSVGRCARGRGAAQERRPLGKQFVASSRWVVIQASVPSSRRHTLSQLLLAEHRAAKKTLVMDATPSPLL